MLLVVAFILGSAFFVKAEGDIYYINNENLEMTEQQYNNLLNLGFTEEQIERMDYNTFVENKDINATLVSEIGRYVKTTTSFRNGIKRTVTQELTKKEIEHDMALNQQQKQIQTTFDRTISGALYDGLTINDYRYVSTKIAILNDNDSMRFKTDVEWLEMPSTRSYDIVGIGIEASKIHIISIIAFREDWQLSNGSFGYDLTCYPKIESTGGSALYGLPSGSLEQLKSYMYITVAKNNNVPSITELVAYGDSKHALSSVNPNNVFANYTVNTGAGIDIDYPYCNSYDSILPADAHFYGLWQ